MRPAGSMSVMAGRWSGNTTGSSPARDAASSSTRRTDASERHHPSRAHGLVGGEHDAERPDGVVHVIRQVEILLDRTQEIKLLALAEGVVVRFVRGADPLVGLRESAIVVQSSMMEQDLVGLGMRID